MTDATGENPTTPIEDSLLARHRTIREMTYRVESAPDLHELLLRLADLWAVLVPHFAEEEAPEGFFDVIRDRASRHLGRVAQLGRDHAAFLAEIDRLADRARGCLAGPVAEILRQGQDLARRLREHEAGENDLLIDAMYTDIGEDD
jgi:hypothetical protein